MQEKQEKIIDLFDLGCAMMVFSFNAPELTTKDTILRNFIAKSISQLRSIKLLNRAGQVLDCYIVYRSMVDRLGHLYYLERTNSFQEFDDWSFIQQIDANNRSLSDPVFKGSIQREFFLPKEDDKERYKALKTSKSDWKRPYIEDEFRKRDLYFLYTFGYDYASTHVHPMANDGMVEYFGMTKSPPEKILNHVDYQGKLIIQNSTLISSLTVNECLNLSSFQWRAVVFKFIESFRKAINGQENEFELNFLKMKTFIDNNLPLGERIAGG